MEVLNFNNNNNNIKVVDNVENYLNVKFQPKLMQRSRENGKKNDFLKNCL